MSDIREAGDLTQAAPIVLRHEPQTVPRGVPPTDRLPLPQEPAALPIELSAFQGSIDPALLAAAARRAEDLGVGGEEVLRCHRLASPDQITHALAAHLGLRVDPLDDRPTPPSPQLLKAADTSVLPRIGADGRMVLTVAPRGHAIRRLARALNDNPSLAPRLRLAAPERLAQYVRRVGAGEVAREAVQGLLGRWPDLSASALGRAKLRWFAIGLAGFALAAGLLAPDRFLFAMQIFLASVFLAWIGLRVYACRFGRMPSPEPEIPDRDLPIYTIIVALYREAPMVPQLVAALKRIRYPPEKLDIKLVLEADDAETLSALQQLSLTPPFELITAPAAGPRTKPKALVAALPFARGSFLVVYDAEDDPDPDQLRMALAAFAAGPPELGCLQARLAVDNAHDNWLSRQFAAEYAGQFEVLLPALAKMNLPLPLGGTSNHFRTDVLRKLGGWDPFNVTEDADLGMRLARFGYRAGVIDSATWEEAPVRIRQWLGQRTRWFKGWLQTWLVHMRHPLRLRRELGLFGFVALQLLVGGTVLAALVHPYFLVFVVDNAASGKFLAAGEPLETFRNWLAWVTLAAGYLGSIVLGVVGLARRNMLKSAWVLATIPLYWLLLSWAAWRALLQLVTAPYRWEKTEHGLARSSLRVTPPKPVPRGRNPHRRRPYPRRRHAPHA